MVSLRNILSILLLFIYLSSNTELHEFFRVPILFEHFSEHKQKYGDISFVDFLVMHYKTSVTHDDHDNNLPFKGATHACVASYQIANVSKLVLIKNTSAAEIHHSSLYKEIFIQSPLNEIFQPPKLS